MRQAGSAGRSRPTLTMGKLLLLIQGHVLGRVERQGQCLENLSPGNRYAALGEPLIVGTGFMSSGDSEFLLQEKPFELFQLYQ